jgi:hypothetical protein
MPDIFVNKSKNQEQITENVKMAEKIPPKQFDIAGVKAGGGTVHLFTSYCEDPDDITFENQDEDEKILLFIRKDLITNLPWVLAGIILIFFPFVIISVLSILHVPIIVLPQNYIFVSIVFYYLFVTSFLFISFITWYFNIDIVTEKRVVDVDFEGIVYKNIAATKLSLVQDVSYSQVGVVRTIFDYGDVLVQTAGTIDNFTFEAVPRPEDAVHVIENLIGRRHE